MLWISGSQSVAGLFIAAMLQRARGVDRLGNGKIAELFILRWDLRSQILTRGVSFNLGIRFKYISSFSSQSNIPSTIAI